VEKAHEYIVTLHFPVITSSIFNKLYICYICMSIILGTHTVLRPELKAKQEARRGIVG
jgi:hypothetical protein